MVTRSNFEPDSALGGGCSVAWLESRELSDEEYTGHLSAGERVKYMSLPNQRRKSEWLAGRLAAKYLFLTQMDMSKRTQGRRWTPTLSKLSAETLRVYSPWMYRKVEAVTTGGKPFLTWCGQVGPEGISISHSGDVSCASIARGAATGIDLQTTEPRIDAFYRNNFTEAERSWAVCGSEGDSNKANWFFTLLWTLKESALKLGWLNSLWNLPRIEILGLPGPKNIEPFWYGETISDDFAVFSLTIKEHGRLEQVRVAVTGTRNSILTVMNPVGVVK